MSIDQPEAFRKFYLGDGVYVEVVGGGLRLSTDRSDRHGLITHFIYLDEDAMDSLVEYYERAKEQAAALRKECADASEL